ncbi:hypothetical protein [Plantibacter sp. YIM 135347]|uniref:hypothetical protein n=1 Tax=Plantibacter sp. YIM 135347 TaxID=3423919 RepID=UPI003D32F8E4
MRGVELVSLAAQATSGIAQAASTPVPEDNGYYPPAQYSMLWPVLGLLLIALVIAWYVWMTWYVRRRTAKAQTTTRQTPSPATLRVRYLGLIDEIEHDFGAGALSTRKAHQKLGLIVRMYAHESSGVRAQVMTLDDLNQAKLFPVARAVSSYYPAEFREAESGSVHDAAEMARQVVTTWG